MTAYPTKPKPINKGIMIGVASRDNRTRKYFDSADFVLYGVQMPHHPKLNSPQTKKFLER